MRAVVVAAFALAAGGLPALAQEESEGKEGGKEEPTPEERVRQRLEEQPITLNFEETPFSDVIGFLRDVSGVSFVLAPEVAGADEEPRVSFRLRDLNVEEALRLVLASAKATDEVELTYSVWCGAVFIHGEDRPPPEPPAVEGELEGRLRRNVTVNFPGAPLTDVIQFFADITGVSFSYTDAAREALDADAGSVALRLKATSLADALSHATLPYGFVWRVEDGAVVVDVAPEEGEGG